MASFCAACGGALPEGANYCSVCGKAVNYPGPVQQAPMRPLVRPKAGRKIAGVCQGLANHFGVDVTLVRLVAVISAILLFPIGLVAYGLCWLIVPEEALIAPTLTTFTPTS